MIAPIKRFYFGDWKFVIMADVCRNTGLCMLDLFAVQQKDIEASDLEKWSADELISALTEPDIQHNVSTTLQERKDALIHKHAVEIRFLQRLKEALDELPQILTKPDTAALNIYRWEKRLKKMLYKFDLVDAYRLSLVRQMLETRDEKELETTAQNLEKSQEVMMDSLKSQLANVEMATWRTLLGLPVMNYDADRLKEHHILYQDQWFFVCSFMVSRDYQKEAKAFCKRFVDNTRFRRKILRHETLTYTPGQKKAS